MIEFIKNIFYNSHLNFLNIGDIIWAKRYNTKEEENVIPLGHRTGPYIIIYKLLLKVYALECTSNDKEARYKIKLNTKIDDRKDTFVYLNKIVLLNKDRYIKKVGNIDKEELDRLYRYIFIFSTKNNLRLIPVKKIKYNILKGDIVKYNNSLFYVKDLNEKSYFIMQVTRRKNGDKRIKINNTYYSFDFNNVRKINKNEKLILIDIVNENIIRRIDSYKVKKETRNIERGVLIKYMDKYFYIYGEYEYNFLAFRVYLTKTNKKMRQIIIKGGQYYTLFEDLILKKSDDMKIIRKAYDREMDEIKKLRKHIRKHIRNNFVRT